MLSFPDGFTAVVVGAKGALANAFATHLESDSRCGRVIRLGRSTEPPLDLLDEASIMAAAGHLAELGPLHLVIDATGVLHGQGFAPEKAITQIDPDAAARVFAINATGPILILKHLLPLMPREGKAAFATLSARVGSISDNQLGGWYAYRASKAALNMLLKTAAIEIARKRPDAVCLALHPGTVATPLSAPYAGTRKVFTPEESADRLLAVIDGADAAQSGTFRAYDGTEIPW